LRLILAFLKVGECYRDFSTARFADRANPQHVQTVFEALHAHCPRNLKESNWKKGRPSMRLNCAIWSDVYSEGTLFGLARNKRAVPASSFANDAVENENRTPALLSLDYVPDLSNSTVMD
jgi:hypothetical protein